MICKTVHFSHADGVHIWTLFDKDMYGAKVSVNEISPLCQDKRVINKTIYIALGVNLQGEKKLLGLWIAETEGAKFWLSVLTNLYQRGDKDFFIICVDGLSGFPGAIESQYPKSKIQLCI